MAASIFRMPSERVREKKMIPEVTKRTKQMFSLCMTLFDELQK